MKNCRMDYIQPEQFRIDYGSPETLPAGTGHINQDSSWLYGADPTSSNNQHMEILRLRAHPVVYAISGTMMSPIYIYIFNIAAI